jgi:hypothetical protein
MKETSERTNPYSNAYRRKQEMDTSFNLLMKELGIKTDDITKSDSTITPQDANSSVSKSKLLNLFKDGNNKRLTSNNKTTHVDMEKDENGKIKKIISPRPQLAALAALAAGIKSIQVKGNPQQVLAVGKTIIANLTSSSVEKITARSKLSPAQEEELDAINCILNAKKAALSNPVSHSELGFIFIQLKDGQKELALKLFVESLTTKQLAQIASELENIAFIKKGVSCSAKEYIEYLMPKSWSDKKNFRKEYKELVDKRNLQKKELPEDDHYYDGDYYYDVDDSPEEDGPPDKDTFSSTNPFIKKPANRPDVSSPSKKFILAEGDLSAEGLSAQYGNKALFVFPGNTNHNTPTTTPHSYKSGKGLARVAKEWTGKGRAALSLPTKTNGIALATGITDKTKEEAVLALWKAAGAGFKIVLPVRPKESEGYFARAQKFFVNERREKLEPNFWGGVEKSGNPELAKYYLEQLLLLKKFLDGPQTAVNEIPLKFKTAYEEGRRQQALAPLKRDDWYLNDILKQLKYSDIPEKEKLATLIDENKIIEAFQCLGEQEDNKAVKSIGEKLRKTYPIHAFISDSVCEDLHKNPWKPLLEYLDKEEYGKAIGYIESLDRNLPYLQTVKTKIKCETDPSIAFLYKKLHQCVNAKEEEIETKEEEIEKILDKIGADKSKVIERLKILDEKFEPYLSKPEVFRTFKNEEIQILRNELSLSIIKDNKTTFGNAILDFQAEKNAQIRKSKGIGRVLEEVNKIMEPAKISPSKPEKTNTSQATSEIEGKKASLNQLFSKYLRTPQLFRSVDDVEINDLKIRLEANLDNVDRFKEAINIFRGDHSASVENSKGIVNLLEEAEKIMDPNSPKEAKQPNNRFTFCFWRSKRNDNHRPEPATENDFSYKSNLKI